MQDSFLEIDDYIRQKQYRLVNSVLVVKEERILTARYYNGFNRDSRNNIKSVWKSILSICTGICLDKGLIRSLDEPIMNYLPEFGRNNYSYHKLITIRHLLTMSSGIYWNGGIHYHCPMIEQLFKEKNWLDYISDIAMRDVPGMRYLYKEWDVMLLSAIIGNASKMSSYEFCSRYLYRPLGILSKPWALSPCGISYNIIPGYEEDSDLTALDMAKIGRLVLHHGVFEGERIVSEEYISQAVSPSIRNTGYGYLFWLYPDSIACRGYGGQEINVWPDMDLVVVIQATPTSRAKSYRDILDVVKGIALK